jgi:hypothetical protein
VRSFANVAVCSVALLLSSFSIVAFARAKSAGNFGGSRGLTFYTAPELSLFNERLGNSPRLTADKEFGRALTHAVNFDFLDLKETAGWGIEAQHWAETLRGTATNGDGDPRSEATLAFVRLWLSGSVRLWPWVGPVIVKRNTNIFGHTIIMNKAKPLKTGFFSHAFLSTGPLLWRHDYYLSDAVNQTAINYATRTISWEGGVRWTLGYRLGRFCDVGFELSFLAEITTTAPMICRSTSFRRLRGPVVKASCLFVFSTHNRIRSIDQTVFLKNFHAPPNH